jgi:hypothetical protein
MFHLLTQQLIEIGPVYAHLDAKSDSHGWTTESSGVIFLENRAEGYWGHWSVVEATLRLIERVLTNPEVKRMTLMSGSHYNFWPPAEIAVRATSRTTSSPRDRLQICRTGRAPKLNIAADS